jgi:hypothetical protein
MIINNDLEGKLFFVSASFPSADRSEKFYRNTNPLYVSNAIVEMVEAILIRNGKIVFGGHPTISPLFLSIIDNIFSKLIGINPKIFPVCYIYQSEYFKGKQSKFTNQLFEKGYGQLIWTENTKDRKTSLEIMREKMLTDLKLDGAIFIGGMEGIRDEFELFTKYYPTKVAFLIGSTGGNSEIILNEIIESNKTGILNYPNQDLIEKSRKTHSYTALAKSLFNNF